MKRGAADFIQKPFTPEEIRWIVDRAAHPDAERASYDELVKQAKAGLSLYLSEGREERLRPNVLGTAWAIWRTYLGLTLASAAYIVLPGYGVAPTLFDAVNHAMTGQSPGGFSTLDDSIAGYDSYAMDLVYLPPMLGRELGTERLLSSVANPDHLPLFHNLQTEPTTNAALSGEQK